MQQTMRIDSLKELQEIAERFRRRLESAYGPETASPNFPGSALSAGQCAATAAVFNAEIGGSFASARVDGLSHWFNRISIGPDQYDVDLTGDQFGRPTVQIGSAGSLYQGTRERSVSELNEETTRRAQILARKAGLDQAA
jgi:hypothetical protein